MSNIAQKTEKRTDWSLTPGEIIQGIAELETGELTCFQIGAGRKYGLEPKHGAGTMVLVFDAMEVRNAYAQVYEVDYPHEVRDFSEKEMYGMFFAVKEYCDREYQNAYTEETIFIRPATKKIPW